MNANSRPPTQWLCEDLTVARDTLNVFEPAKSYYSSELQVLLQFPPHEEVFAADGSGSVLVKAFARNEDHLMITKSLLEDVRSNAEFFYSQFEIDSRLAQKTHIFADNDVFRRLCEAKPSQQGLSLTAQDPARPPPKKLVHSLPVDVRALVSLLEEGPAAVEERVSFSARTVATHPLWLHWLRADYARLCAHNAVDEVVQRVSHCISSYPSAGRALVLLLGRGTGGAVSHEDERRAAALFGVVERALDLGWSVRLWSWRVTLDERFARLKALNDGVESKRVRLSLWYLDEFEELLRSKTAPPSSSSAAAAPAPQRPPAQPAVASVAASAPAAALTERVSVPESAFDLFVSHADELRAALAVCVNLELFGDRFQVVLAAADAEALRTARERLHNILANPHALLAGAAGVVEHQEQKEKANDKAEQLHVFVDNYNIFRLAMDPHAPQSKTRLKIDALAALVEAGRDVRQRVVFAHTSFVKNGIWTQWCERDYHLMFKKDLEDEVTTNLNELIARFRNEQRTLVLAVGDVDKSGVRPAFHSVMQNALSNGWKVEMWTWSAALSRQHKTLRDSHLKQGSGRFVVRLLDEHRERITYESNRAVAAAPTPTTAAAVAAKAAPKAEQAAAAATAVRESGSENIFVFVDNFQVYRHADNKSRNSRIAIPPLVRVIEGGRSAKQRVVFSDDTFTKNPIFRFWKAAKYDTWFEKVVPENVITKILNVIKKPENNKGERTLVLAVCDMGKNQAARPAFLSVVDRALSLGWKVELWTWEATLSDEYKRLRNTKARFAVHLLDSHREEIVSDGNRGASTSGSGEAAREEELDNAEEGYEFCCPITTDVIKDPVVTPLGHVFERDALVEWIERTGCCPLSRDPLAVGDLFAASKDYVRRLAKFRNKGK